MFAAHLAAGLAIKVSQPKAPAWSVLIGAFLPDLFWIGFAAVGAEPASDTAFFDGWSHSVALILIQATIFSLCFYRLGSDVMLAAGGAVLSHLLLDLPIHPRPLQLYPHAMFTVGGSTWTWGQEPLALDKSRYWWLQSITTIPLLIFYSVKAWHQKMALSLIVASCLIVIGLHAIF